MKIDHYSYSSHKLYESCPQRFQFSKLYPDVRAEQPDYVTFGYDYHKAVENYHSGKVYNYELIKEYTDKIPQDFFDQVELELLCKLKELDTGEEIDVPFMLRIDGINEKGLYDLKTTSNTLSQSVLNKSDQATLYCYAWFLLFAKIPVFNYIIFSKKKNEIFFKETYRSEKNFKEFFNKMKEFDKKVKNDEFPKTVGWQCLSCPFAEKYCLNKALLEVLQKTHGKL